MTEQEAKLGLVLMILTGGLVGYGVYQYTNSIILGIGFGMWAFWSSASK